MGFARLARPANLPTAAADICAGIAIGLYVQSIDTGLFLQEHIGITLSLVFSSVFLYAGGVVFNDVFDAELDAIERPERAIPSGLIPLGEAKIWGSLLLLAGILLAFNCTVVSGMIALLLGVTIFTYDAYSKHHGFLGPLNMGICRGLNLLLGISILGSIMPWWISIVPIIYIFAITLISRGEVHGNNKNHILWAGFIYAIVVIAIALILGLKTNELLIVVPFLILFAILIFLPLSRAYRENSPENIKKAVISGVLSLIVMNACWVAGFSSWYLALGVLLLLPLSVILSKLFAVT